MYHEKQYLQHCLKHALNNLLQYEAFTAQQLNQLSDSIGARRTWVLGNYDANTLSAALMLHDMEVQWLDTRGADLSSLDLLQVHHQQQQSSSSSNPAAGPTCIAAAASTQHIAAEQKQMQQQQAEWQQTAQCTNRFDCLESCTGHSEAQQSGYVPMQNELSTSPAIKQQHSLTTSQQDQLQQDPVQSALLPGLVGLVLNVAARGWWSAVFGGRHWLALKYLQGQWWNLDGRLSAPESFMISDTDEGDGGAHRLQQYLQQQMVEGAHVMAVYWKRQGVQQERQEQGSM